MANFIYKPKGKAKEYGDYAINIYTGCSHQCFYCYSPNVLRGEKEMFHTDIKPREGIIEGVKEQLKQNGLKDKIIHLCFTCDPYPKGYDTSVTREIIKAIKESGNHVQILTKNGEGATRDFDLLDSNDWFGITYAGYSNPHSNNPPAEEPGAGSPFMRLAALYLAHQKGIKTWVSAEPVLNDADVLRLIAETDYVDLWKVGKLNYHPSEVNWAKFGKDVEVLLKEKGVEYYIKESLRKEMGE